MRLNVPMIFGQKKNDCWHACVQMLYAYKNQSSSPMQDTRDADTGLDASDPNAFVKLATASGLKSPPEVSSGIAATFTWEKINSMLLTYGPLFCAVTWSTGDHHVIVVTGVESNGTLYENDPAPGKGSQTRTVEWFNQKIAKGYSAPILFLP